MTKEYLKEKKIPYKEYDVSQDEKAQQEMIKKSNQYGVPVIDIDGKIIIGFDKVKLEELIQKPKNKSVSKARNKLVKTKSKTKKRK
jgi:glutaredoxin